MYYYTSVIFEENFENLNKALEELDMISLQGHINGAMVSPVHLSDTETPKKHIHVIWQSTKRSLTKADREALRLSGLAANGYVMSVSNLPKMQEYLTHKNHPNKQQFDCEPSVHGDYELPQDADIKQVYIYIIDNSITEYEELINSLISEDNTKLIDLVSKRSYAIQSYLMSKRERAKRLGSFNELPV